VEAVRAAVERAARSTAKVLITGESGVGKDVVARYLHARSPRASGPLVAVNCGGLTETLLESELFGHVKGAFTGAYREKVGKLQLAHGGTIFLDEVGEMTMRMQALLLRFLDSGEIHPVGADTSPARVDVRVVAATNRNLRQMAAEGQFRQDLYYRIRVVEIHVPPLRDRIEDLRALVDRFCASNGRKLQFTDAAWRALESYRWPGNVRELANVLEQISAMTERDVIDAEDLPLEIAPGPGSLFGPFVERRRQPADELYEGLVSGRYTFWNRVHPLFMSRDLTRHDVRDLIRRGLRATNGSYRLLLPLYGMSQNDYKRLMNFLTTHDCGVDFRAFRGQDVQPAPRRPAAAGERRGIGSVK
jgi:transcriptional regulator with PAS, ATPase and Fis domain